MTLLKTSTGIAAALTLLALPALAQTETSPRLPHAHRSKVRRSHPTWADKAPMLCVK